MPDNFKNKYDSDSFSLSVCNIGREKCKNTHSWGPGIRDHYIIHYVISGKGKFIVNQKEYIIEKYQCFIIYPNTVVFYEADKYDPWEYIWVGFTGNESKIILDKTLFSENNPVSPVIEKNNYESLIQNILYSYGTDSIANYKMTGHLYIFFSELIKTLDTDKSNNLKNMYIQNAIKYIENNYEKQITVLDTANYLNLSRSQLFRIFKDEMNISPKEFLVNYRIKMACHFLKNTNYSINTVSEATGFSDQLYFSKIFKKKTGISPTKYRKK